MEELLGISKKRLSSIINATKCPSDTESSDSEVEKVEEHISLEEISSDSEDDLQNKVKKRKKKNSTSKSTEVSKEVEKNGGTIDIYFNKTLLAKLLLILFR